MDLIARLDEAMVRADADRPIRERVSHTVWDIGACVRQLWYKWTQPTEASATDAKSQWTFRLGDAIERIVVEWLSQARVYHTAGEWGTYEHPSLTYPVRYKLDFEFVDDDGEIAVVDVKSGYGRAISEMRKTGRPKDSYTEQLAFYLGARGRRRGYLLYVGRDSAYRTQVRYDVVDGKLMTSMGGDTWETGVSFRAQIERLGVLEAAVAAGEPPERPYVAAIKNGEIRDRFVKAGVAYKSDWHCRYCPFATTCWADELDRLRDGDNAEAVAEAGQTS